MASKQTKKQKRKRTKQKIVFKVIKNCRRKVRFSRDISVCPMISDTEYDRTIDTSEWWLKFESIFILTRKPV